MPKSCSVPCCMSEPGTDPERRDFYKFPLQDTARLQQWLKNMGREDWSPSRHQHVCHQHFDPSCFRVRWGVRCMEKNAVPTVFPETGKRKASDLTDRQSKRLHIDTDENPAMSDSEGGRVDWPQKSPSADCECSLLEPLTSQDGLESGVSFPITFLHTGESEENTEVLVMVENQDELVNAITSALLVQGRDLIVTDGSEQGTMDESQGHVVALYHTLPQFSFSSDTVLSSALSSQPITSTLPIVSNHTKRPASTDGGDEERSEDEDEELQPDQKLEEHSYHRSSVTKEQLQSTVCELQKQVKVLRQRQRRHVEQLLCLENTVSQLRQSNLLNQERLQLLERAYLQSSTAAPNAAETVTIIYEEDGSYLCTPLADTRAEL